jgi:hypothetical protein
VLSFLFGTNSETELIKCGWNQANIGSSPDGDAAAGYFSRQHDLVGVHTIYRQPYFVEETSVIYSWTTVRPTIERNRLSCRGSRPFSETTALQIAIGQLDLTAHFQFKSEN